MSDKKTIEKTKLIKLLSTFSALEWKRFGRFVQSAYHNSNQKVVSLYNYLKKVFPFEDLKLLEQERVYKKIFGNIPFKLNTFQSCCSDLYGLATDFIVDVHLQSEKRKRDKILIDALSERNYGLFKGASQQLIREIETQHYFLDEEDFLMLYQLNNELHHHIETDTFSAHQLELEKTLVNLNAFYQATKLQVEAENRGTQNILNKKRELKDTDRNQLNHLFQEAAKLHNTKQTHLYFQLKEKVFDNWHQLKTKHKTNLLVHLLNFSFTNELMQKELGYEALTLYKIGIKDKLFVINGKMRDIEFFSISMIGFKFESEKWTINFIETHKKFLTSEVSIFLLPLVYAYRAIFQYDYKEVIHLLSRVNPSNNLNYLSKIKRLLIRAYFEGVIRGEEQYRSPLSYEINSLRKMMTRNDKLSQIKIESSINFLNLIKKLLDLYSIKPYDSKQIQSFELLINNTNPLVLKSWLQEKVVEIKNAASFKRQH